MREQSAVRDERCEDPTKLANGDILQAVIAPLARLWRRSTSPAVDLKPESAERHYRDGVLKVRGGDMDGALAEFDKALDRAPGFADAVLARAELLDGQGRCDAARGEYERARQLWSEMPAGAPDRRYLFRRRGHFAFEIEAYELVRANVRNKILPQLAHGNALLVRGRAEEALDSYERALRIRPNLPEVLALKGEALSALGRYEEAIQAFDTVLAAFPADGETLNARGIARMALGKLRRSQRRLASPARAAAAGSVGGACLRGDAAGKQRGGLSQFRSGPGEGTGQRLLAALSPDRRPADRRTARSGRGCAGRTVARAVARASCRSGDRGSRAHPGGHALPAHGNALPAGRPGARRQSRGSPPTLGRGRRTAARRR